MITDEQLDDLPDDNDEAFVLYESLLREQLQSRSNNDDWSDAREYANYILAFLEYRTFDLDIPRDVPASDGDFGKWYWLFRKAVDAEIPRIRLRIAIRKKQFVTVLRLSGDFKTQIGGHLTAIRNIAANADLGENKRDAILRRVNHLQMEVDRDRTRTEAAMALLLEITSAVSKGAKNLDPAINRMERIIRIFAATKDQEELAALTSSPERKRLQGPSASNRSNCGEAATPRDGEEEEIPF
jgi:hypothetical protein